jgi:hypothetical protein
MDEIKKRQDVKEEEELKKELLNLILFNIDNKPFIPKQIYSLPAFSVQLDRSSSINKLEDRVNNIDLKLDTIAKAVQDIKKYVEIKEDIKEEAILFYKEKISFIKNILSVYCKLDIDKISLLTIIEPREINSTLSSIIKIQIELENKYDKILFDFMVDPLIEGNEINVDGWNPLYKRSA